VRIDVRESSLLPRKSEPSWAFQAVPLPDSSAAGGATMHRTVRDFTKGTFELVLSSFAD